MSELTDYRSDVTHSVASLREQLERTRQYVGRMYTGSDGVGNYVCNVLKGLLDGFAHEVLEPFSQVLNVEGTELQTSYEQLQLLTMEWNRVSQVVHLVRTNYRDVELFAPVIDEAQRLVGTNKIILPFTDGPFSVTSFRYLQNLNILNIPVTAAYTPWEWSVFWHEIAGAKVASDSEALKNAFTSIEGRVDSGWPQAWFDELYEDAISVLSFGEPFIDIFHRILSREEIRVEGDGSHPPMSIRLNIACRLLELSGASKLDRPFLTAKETSPFEESVAKTLSKLLPDDFKRIKQDINKWPIIKKVRYIMEQYVDDPSQGQILFKEMGDFISEQSFIFPETVDIVAHTMPPEELTSGKWHEDDQIYSWRGHLARLIPSGIRIRAYRYRLVGGTFGGNARLLTISGERINATWYTEISG